MTKNSDLSEIVQSSFHLGFFYLPRFDNSQYAHLAICEGKTEGLWTGYTEADRM